MSKKQVIFLDRDGVLIEDKNYTYKIEDLEVLPGVIDGLRLLQEQFLLFIITNQSGIGRGYFTIKDFHNFNNNLLNKLKEADIKIENTYFCPHIKEDNCDCRKPKTKFIELILSNYIIDLKNSWMIGDHPSDIEFGVNAGCKTIYLTTGHGDRHLEELEVRGLEPTIITDNFLDASKKIIELM